MKILITGVAGLLGSRLADYLIKVKNVEVIGIDNLSGGYIENLNSEIKFYNLDLISESISHVFEDNVIDYVFHFAAYAAEGLSPFIRKFNYDSNLKVTASIVNECIKFNVKRLVFASSMAVYGYGNNNTFDESQFPQPIDPYGVAKFACEMDIQIAGKQHDLDWCIIRPHNVYGINQNIWDKYRNVLGIWMYQHLNNQSMTIYGDGSQKRAFTYIEDCLEPFYKSAINENCSKEIINLGGKEAISILEAHNILKKIFNGGKTKFLESRYEVKNVIPAFQKSIDLLSYTNSTSLEVGLTNMWRWVKTQPNRKRFIWPSYELDKGIYSYWKSNN